MYYQYKISPYSSSQAKFYYVCLKPIDYVYSSIDNKCVCICTPIFYFKLENSTSKDISTIINSSQVIYNSYEHIRFDIGKLYDIPIYKLEIINDDYLPVDMKREKKLKNILKD